MTHAERNAAITRKIEAYTTKFTADKRSAQDALVREGFAKAAPMAKQKKHTAAA